MHNDIKVNHSSKMVHTNNPYLFMKYEKYELRSYSQVMILLK